ncbi:carbohydrate ABC transporter permease [Kribbella kalugense]|uniref:Carbohydrate ABC transporter membrane protein 2 (CUT1 family) n=1 Tax=Kribbella kalugense TaxID=2512221 RepID=A0A4V3G8U2_9ACTN|nr:carbohydrate ABC transporter permease [Kribbella kalugense]TDW24254.1 carbohydrate ABC transporter membrane protein 2 (CUT1 family) [Kribbella kalugense]
MSTSAGRLLSRGSRAPRRRLLHLALLGWAVASLLPLLWTLSASLQSNQEIYSGIHLIPRHLELGNYTQAWTQAHFSTYFKNSVIYTVTIVAGVLIISSLAAYAFARMRFPLKNLVFYLFLIFLTFPLPGSFIPLYVLLVNLGLIDTPLGYILPMINAGLPVAIFILRSFFEEIPREIEESARIDGATRLQVYRLIALPLAKPALATITIFTALSVWNEFLFALVVFSDQQRMPLQVGLMTFQGTFFSQYGLMMAATTITMVPALAIYLVFQRFIVRGVMAGAVRG